MSGCGVLQSVCCPGRYGEEKSLKKRSTGRSAVMLALASILFWSWAATAFKKALIYHSPWFVVFAGSLISTVVLLAMLLFRRKRICFSDIRQGALFGFLNPFLYYLVLLTAYNGLPAQIAMVVNYLWPVVLVILAVPFLGQKLTAGGISGILLSFAGVALMALLGRSTLDIPIYPLLLAFASTLVWAVYWLLNTRSSGETNAVLLMGFAFGSVYLAIYGIFSGESFFTSSASLHWIVYVGVFEMGITYMMWNTALKLASTTASVGSLIFLTPFLALVPISLVVGEGIAPSTLAGLVLVTAGILLEKHFRNRGPLQK